MVKLKDGTNAMVWMDNVTEQCYELSKEGWYGKSDIEIFGFVFNR